MNIIRKNPAYASLRSVQSIWSSVKGFSITRSGGLRDICDLIFDFAQCWDSVVFGPLSLTPNVLIPTWCRLHGLGCPIRRCHSPASPFESGRGSPEVIRFFQVCRDGRRLVIDMALKLCSGTCSMACCPWISCILHIIESSCLAR